jgi:hypothetical protein
MSIQGRKYARCGIQFRVDGEYIADFVGLFLDDTTA